MTLRICALLISTALVCLAAPQETPSKAKESPLKATCELTSSDYLVYTALLAQLGKPEDPEEAWQGKEMLISDATGAPSDLKAQWGGFGGISKAFPSQETLDDFVVKAKSLCSVKPQFGDSQSYTLINHDELEKTFKKGPKGWDNFYKKYPKAAGFWTFSRPGYNAAEDEAVLYVSHSCGGLCGTGHLYFLAKKNGAWSVTNRTMLWIS